MKNYRYELKFNLNQIEYNELKNFIANKSFFKAYPDRKINSLYFDSVVFKSLSENISGISDREKLRLRWYNNKDFTPVIEKKIRTGRFGSKISFEIKNLSKKNIEIIPIIKLKKIIFDYLLSVNSSFKMEYYVPSLFINYEREYFQNRNGVRLTIDKNIIFKSITLNSTINKSKAIKHNCIIMEIKFGEEKKEAVKNLIQNLNLIPQRHSKYVTGLTRLDYSIYI